MTFYRIFSAVNTVDTGCDWYDETENHDIMMDGIAHLVNIGSVFSVRVYASRYEFMSGSNPYAVLNYIGNGVVEVISIFPGCDKWMHVYPPVTPRNVAERVGARVRTLARRYRQTNC